MVDLADIENKTAAPAGADAGERRPLPRWAITLASVVGMLVLWEIFGRQINPVFGSYPSAIAVAFWELLLSGELWSALLESLQPFFVGYGLAIVIGIPVGLVVGRFRSRRESHRGFSDRLSHSSQPRFPAFRRRFHRDGAALRGAAGVRLVRDLFWKSGGAHRPPLDERRSASEPALLGGSPGKPRSALYASLHHVGPGGLRLVLLRP